MTDKTNKGAAQAAQTAAPEITEQPKPKIPDVNEFLAMFQSPSNEGIQTLPWKSGFDKSMWHWHYFRFDQVAKDAAKIERDGFVKVTKDGGMWGFKFSDMLDESAFDPATGCVHKGILFDRHSGGKPVVESYLYMQPMSAKIAREQVEIEHSNKYVRGRQNSREGIGEDSVQQRAERDGIAKVEYSMTEDGDGDSWG